MGVLAVTVPFGAPVGILSNRDAWLPTLSQTGWMRLTAGPHLLPATWVTIFNRRNLVRFRVRKAYTLGTHPTH